MNEQSAPVRFIRKMGRIIPIRQKEPTTREKASEAVHKVTDPVIAHVNQGLNTVNLGTFKVNPKLDALGLGLSVASGVVGAATFGKGAKVFASGLAAAHVLDAGGIAANVSSVAGTGLRKERVKQAARQEVRNLAVGNAVYAAGLLGLKRNRTALFEATKKILKFGRKALVT